MVILRRPSTGPAGFTLVEVMMAATILVVGFIGLIQAVTINSEVLDTARKQQVATQIMDAEIERLRASTWNVISGLPASATITINSAGTISGNETAFALSNFTTANGDDNTALASLAKGFTCSYTRAYLRPAGATSSTVTFLSLIYTVSWTSNTGRTYSRSTLAYFGENGLHLSFQRS
jgi:prepilin-type N-terminal cleavage/methylation domain-containing protein